MQNELAAEGENTVIVGINGIGFESGNEAFTDGRDLAWLQDIDEADVWTAWAIEYRDVAVLDEDNRLVEVFNLTEQDLADETTYAALRDLLIR